MEINTAVRPWENHWHRNDDGVHFPEASCAVSQKICRPAPCGLIIAEGALTIPVVVEAEKTSGLLNSLFKRLERNVGQHESGRSFCPILIQASVCYCTHGSG